MSKKEALLLAAKELFGEYGFSGTTFRLISQRADVALGLLSHHYGSKEKMFLASGLDVLGRLQSRLEQAVANSSNGLEAVHRYCCAYLEFSIDPHEHFLVLIRCSPYSDITAQVDREVLTERFDGLFEVLQQCVYRGVQDKTVLDLPPRDTAMTIMCSLVGAVRTRLLTPYCPFALYDDVIAFIDRSISTK